MDTSKEGVEAAICNPIIRMVNTGASPSLDQCGELIDTARALYDQLEAVTAERDALRSGVVRPDARCVIIYEDDSVPPSHIDDFEVAKATHRKMLDNWTCRLFVDLSALTTLPASSIRDEALEEAAKVADYMEKTCGRDQDGNPYVGEDAHLFGGSVLSEAAAAIRALKSQEAE